MPNLMNRAFRDMSRPELDTLLVQYYRQLDGPLRGYQVAINCASQYLSAIPRAERTPEICALQELFSEVEDSSWDALYEDLEFLKNEFATPELQNEYWFDVQNALLICTRRAALYYPLAQQVAAQYGFSLPEETVSTLEQEPHWWNDLLQYPA